MASEIEVKFFLTDIEAVRNRILELDLTSEGRVFERNIRFEDEKNSLLRNRSLLRLRQDTRARLTFKADPSGTDTDDEEFKVFEELEVTVSDFATMQQILAALGYHTAQVYEKWRETFTAEPVELCLDTLPFGHFLEIEGPRDAIRQMAQDLALPWESRILENYLALFAALKDSFRLPFSDITFDAFKALPHDFSDRIRSFEIGKAKRT